MSNKKETHAMRLYVIAKCGPGAGDVCAWQAVQTHCMRLSLSPKAYLFGSIIIQCFFGQSGGCLQVDWDQRFEDFPRFFPFDSPHH